MADTIIKMDDMVTPNLFRYDNAGIWSDRRRNLAYDTSRAFTMWIRCRFTNMALGSAPNDADIYATHIGKNAPDALTLKQEIEANGLSEVEEKGITVFPRSTFIIRSNGTYIDIGTEYMKSNPGIAEEIINRELANGAKVMVLPVIKGYQWKGSFKESIQMLRQAAKDRLGGGKTATRSKKKKNEEPAEDAYDQTELAMMNECNPPIEEQKPKRRGRPKKKELNDDNEGVNVVSAAYSDDSGKVQHVDVSTKITKEDRQEHFNDVYDRKYACSDITAFKKVVDGTWFVNQPMIPIFVPEFWYDNLGEKHASYNADGKLNTFSRALRADTAQGPRQAIACSEYVPAGSEFYFSVTLMNRSDVLALIETMDYKSRFGMLQWRSGGMGTLEWTPCDSNGVPLTKFPDIPGVDIKKLIPTLK